MANSSHSKARCNDITLTIANSKHQSIVYCCYSSIG